MKKILKVVCFSLVTLGFSATSALAANDVAANASSTASVRYLQNGALMFNQILMQKKVISAAESNENIQKILYVKNEQEAKAVYNALGSVVVKTPFYQ
ncbi:hypothetical protein [Pseudomonas cerasi]